MCGILALFSKLQQLPFIEVAQRLQLLKPRGPDRGKMCWGDEYIIGFQRLCINDLSDKGDQPMFLNNKILVCNGEIFNYKDLVKEYNLTLNSQSDCEVILHLYLLLGMEKTIRLLDGDFAFVLYDLDSQTIYAGRDKVGVRPLFVGYDEDKNTVGFASEAKALDFLPKVHQLTPRFFCTAFQKLNKQFLIVFECFYDFPMHPIDDFGYSLKSFLYKAVEKRLLTDRPIGCLLSGGLDSSIVASILCRLLGPRNVRTYSIGMNAKSTDVVYARKVAKFLNTQHTELIIDPETAIGAIPEVVYAVETYDVTTIRASVYMYLLAEFIAKNTNDKVIFSGEGSDELLCGYLYFHYAPNPEEAHKESLRLVSELHKYDVKRADACISSNGLELRVPFLDKDVIDYCTSLPGVIKAPQNGMEKQLLRDLFKDDLPLEVIERRKDGFSDGVSSTKPWFEYIQDFLKTQNTTESEYYKSLFDSYFKNYTTPIAQLWMPKWVDVGNNPSGRVLKLYDTKLSEDDNQ